MNHDPEQLRRLQEVIEESKDPFKSFMNSDVSSVDACDRLLATVREVQADATQIRTRSGNSYFVGITADTVTLQNHWDEEMPVLEYSLEEFETLVLSYLERLKSQGKG